MRDGGAATLQQVGSDDAEVVVGDVREGRAPLYISQGVDAGCAGLQALVRLDRAAFVCLYAGRIEVERLGVRSPSNESTVRRISPPLSCAARRVWVPSKTSIPSSRRISATASATSASSRPINCPPRCTTVTSLPKRLNIWANSSPT